MPASPIGCGSSLVHSSATQRGDERFECGQCSAIEIAKDGTTTAIELICELSYLATGHAIRARRVDRGGLLVREGHEWCHHHCELRRQGCRRCRWRLLHEACELRTQRLATCGLLDDEDVATRMHRARGRDLEGVRRFVSKEKSCQTQCTRLILGLWLVHALILKALTQRVDMAVDSLPLGTQLRDVLIQMAPTKGE